MNETSSYSAAFQFFYLKPIFCTLLSAFIILAGLLAYQSVVKEANPDLQIPYASVVAAWPGAAPELVEQELTNRLEQKINTLADLKSTHSGSKEGLAVISVEFQADAPLQTSIESLRTAVASAEAEFPTGATTPQVAQSSVNNTPILDFMLYGNVDDVALSKLAEQLKKRLEKLSGVSKVDIAGERQEMVEILLIPERLYALRLSATAVRDQILLANSDATWGVFENPDFYASLKLNGRFKDVETLRQLPIKMLEEGNLLRLGDIAQVQRDLSPPQSLTRFSIDNSEFEGGIALSVYQQPGSDTITLATRIKKQLASMRAGSVWLPGVEYTLTTDQSEQIWAQLSNVFKNGLQAMAIVFLVLLIVLSWREALIAGLAIPITFLGALAALYALGFTLNTMVVIGMVLALGLLVDVFILVLEGMHDGVYRQGLTYPQAAQSTVSTYALPAFAGQLTTILALVPLLAISGVSGKFIRLVPLTTIVCLVLSFAVAFLITIPWTRFVLPKKAFAKPSRSDRIVHTLGTFTHKFLLLFVLRKKLLAVFWILLIIFLFGYSLSGAGQLGFTMYPKEDGRTLGITVELAPGTPLRQTEQIAERLGTLLRQQSYFQNIVQYVGEKSPYATGSTAESFGPTTGSHLLGFTATFTPLEQRDQFAYQYLPGLRQSILGALAEVPGARAFFKVDTGGATSGDPIQIQLAGPDINQLEALSQQLQHALSAIPGSADVRDNLGFSSYSLAFQPDHEALQRHGLSQLDLQQQIALAMSSLEIGKFQTSGTDPEIPIHLGFGWPSRDGATGGPTEWSELLSLAVTNGTEYIQLAALASPSTNQVPQAITHSNGQRTLTVLAKAAGTTTAAAVLAALEPTLNALQQNLPADYEISIGGEHAEATETYSSVGQAFMLAMLLVFAVLALLFGSYKQAVIILFTVPLGLMGTLGGFEWLEMPLSFPALIGIIALLGIVVNNAIVIVETSNIHRRNGLALAEAAARGAADRLVPIFSTTLTTVAGLIPLALSSPIWQPLCLAIIFGLSAATVISLLIIPCLLVVFNPQ